MSHKKQILEFSVSRFSYFPSACLIFITVIYKTLLKKGKKDFEEKPLYNTA